MQKIKKQSLKSFLFTYPSYEYMTKVLRQIPNFVAEKFTLERFSNNELNITLHTQVKECACIVLGTLAPPEINIFSFMLLCHTLKKEGSTNITAVLPYLAYSRHDKNEPQKSYALPLIGELLFRAGADKVITFDIHSPIAERVFPIPLISLSPAKLFAKEIITQSMQNATIVAPDEGAIKRCRAVLKEIGKSDEIAYTEKKRTSEGVIHRQLHGSVGKQVIIIDDILDTGKTLVSCCQKLSNVGVKEICVMVTHGLFTGNEWKKLWELGVNRIYCTDTVPLVKDEKSTKIIVLSIIPQLRDNLTLWQD